MQRQNDINNNNADKTEEELNIVRLASCGITPDHLPIICSSVGFVDLYRRLPLVCKLFNKTAKELSQSKILTFIRCKTNQITMMDKALENAILTNEAISFAAFESEFSRREGDDFNLNFTVEIYKTPTFLKYLHNHYFILCHEFFCIPEVNSYIKTISSDLLLATDCVGNENEGQMTFKLELLLMFCLLAEVIETSKGKESFTDLITTIGYSFNTGNPSPKCAADIYNDCRTFVIQNHDHLDPKLIAQFYNCYINHLRRNLDQPTLKKIGELVKEKLEFLKESENQNQMRFNRN